MHGVGGGAGRGQSAAPVPDHCPLGQLEQLLGVSQLSLYEAWPLREQEAGGMNWPAWQSVQPLENTPGVQYWVHEQSSALQCATKARKSMHFMAEPWGQDVRTRWGQPGFPSISLSRACCHPQQKGLFTFVSEIFISVMLQDISDRLK
jgi:hypothetical protein